MLKKFLILGILMVSTQALAATEGPWLRAIDNAAANRQSSTSLGTWQVANPGETYYFRETGTGAAQNNYTEAINVSSCNGNIFYFTPNIASKTANIAGRGKLYYCSTASAALSTCYLITADINSTLEGIDAYTFTGDPGNDSSDLDGLGNYNQAWIEDVPFSFVRAEFSTDPTNTATGQWSVSCKR